MFYFESMPLCVSSCFSVSPVCFSLSVVFPSLPHLSFSFLNHLTCSWSPRQCPCVYNLCSSSCVCQFVLSYYWLPHLGLSFLVSDIWYVSGFGFSLVLSIWVFEPFGCYFVFCLCDWLLCLRSLGFFKLNWLLLIKVAFCSPISCLLCVCLHFGPHLTIP